MSVCGTEAAGKQGWYVAWHGCTNISHMPAARHPGCRRRRMMRCVSGWPKRCLAPRARSRGVGWLANSSAAHVGRTKLVCHYRMLDSGEGWAPRARGTGVGVQACSSTGCRGHVTTLLRPGEEQG
eukprot:1145947-Pelagomonas_calceolata.AAC.5